MSDSWFKVKRSKQTEELLKDASAWALLSLIAYRAKRTNEFDVHNLNPGEALLGDHRACGLTSRKYRTAKKNLEKWGFSTFQATNKGTVAKLTNSHIYDINIDICDNQHDNQTTIKRQSNDNQTTTNKNEKNEKTFKKLFVETGIQYRLAELLFKKILSRNPAHKTPNLQSWAKQVDLMLRVDKREAADIERLILWSQQDHFWQNNILSTSKLREKFDQLSLKAKNVNSTGNDFL